MQKPLDILKKYWQHNEFRSMQESIINSVLEGKDTFALLPTGGGKSVCFQIPALTKPGICLVISPLVALIKDQVANLEQKGIKAIGLTGGISFSEMEILLDNCQFGNYKFLYFSPERLQSDWFLERIKQLPVNQIAIDEAHCVSQWGHDFRPAYLKISILKTLFPTIPFIALTATATKRVQEDVILHLNLENPSFFQKSFARENLGYIIINTEDKLFKIKQILYKNPQSSIVYVRSRKLAVDLARQLQEDGFKATFFHGGLAMNDKMTNMNLWMTNQSQVIVATNAFGMGIDKADVKTVIHYQLPENIENYYQEAGRVGRNGQQAFAILLKNTDDAFHAKILLENSLPDKNFVLNVYVKLCNHLQIAYGEGLDAKYAFNLNQFCAKYNFSVLKTFNSIQFLDNQGVLNNIYEFSQKISIQFLISSKEVIRLMSLHPKHEPIIMASIRSYSGIYENMVQINMSQLAKKANTTDAKVLETLNFLKQLGAIDMQAKGNDSSFVFNEIREDERTINRIAKHLDRQNKLKIEQLQAVLEYVTDDKICKSKFILNYFGENLKQNCGICSVCLSKTSKPINSLSITKEIVNLLQAESMDSRQISVNLGYDSKDVLAVLQELLENQKITINRDNTYSIYTK